MTTGSMAISAAKGAAQAGGSMRYLQVQVMFNQGLAKTFIAPRDILLADFQAAVRAFGRFRSMRFLPDLDETTARQLAQTGNAVMVEARRGGR